MGGEGGPRLELLADDDRPGGWLMLMNQVRQSYVDLRDPAYLDFEYIQGFADVVDALPAGPLSMTHIGGGACTFARYVAHVRPGSPQLVLEPDAEVTALTRARLPLPPGHRIRVRPHEGRAALRTLRDGTADVVVVDAFADGRVPATLTTAEFFAEVARVLRPAGVMLANLPDGGRGGGRYVRRVTAAARTVLPTALLRADPGVFKERRFGNVVLAATRGELPVRPVAQAAARAPLPQKVLAGDALDHFVGGAAPFTDADGALSPAPPDDLWRIG
jgi:spermidine synthase